MTTTQQSSQTNRLIRILDRNAYRGLLHWADPGDGHVSDVHVARYRLDKNTSVEAYTKIYPSDNGRNRGLINEITGYLICSALGIPQPETAFVAMIPVRYLAGTDEASPLIRQLAQQRIEYPAFCTKRLEGKSAAWRLPSLELPTLMEDVKAWEELPSTLALDDTIANVDRHLNNLIRTGKKSFAVIDNGILATTPESGVHHWSDFHLNVHSLFRNRLSEHLFNHSPPDKTISATLREGQKHETAVDKVAMELDFWWRQLLNEADYKAFKNFILGRAAHIEQLLRRRYNWLL